MAETNGDRLKIILRWVQILDRLEPFFKEKGEFRFTARVTPDDGETQETRLPESGHYSVSDHPAWNRLGLDKVIFEGPVRQSMRIELQGEELDFLSANDRLEDYQRDFEGDPASWLGRYLPSDEAPGDPENLSNWRICYEILRA